MPKQYRNNSDITSIEGIHVDKGSLWTLNVQNLLVLEDQDQYVTAPYNIQGFTLLKNKA